MHLLAGMQRATKAGALIMAQFSKTVKLHTYGVVATIFEGGQVIQEKVFDTWGLFRRESPDSIREAMIKGHDWADEVLTVLSLFNSWEK